MAGTTNPADEGLTGPTETTNHINGVRSDFSLGSSLTGIVPVTKIPSLDTIDQYAAEGSPDDPMGQSPWRRIGQGDVSGELATGLIEGYARFVSALTGLEDIAFAVLCQSSTKPSQALICASVTVTDQEQEVQSARQCAVRELDFSYYNRSEVQFALDLALTGGPEKEKTDLNTVAERNCFSLYVRSSADGLCISFTYPKRLIPDAAVSQLLKTIAFHMAQAIGCLQSTGAWPDDPTLDLSILNFPPPMIPPSRDHDSATMPRRTKPYLLHSAFEGWAQKSPTSIALDFVHSLPSASSMAEHSTLTYAALNAAATHLAIHIRRLLSDDTRNTGNRIIPVYMSTSPELYISYLGILKAGYAFCPIPTDAPAQRVREILQDIESSVILGDAEKPSSAPWLPDAADETMSKPTWVNVAEVSRWKHFSGEDTEIATEDRLFEPPDIDHNEIAYLLFTSGSTGKPKGVQVSHLAVTCSIESHATAIPLPGTSAGDFRWFQFASPTFDPSLMEIFVTLSSGGTLCSASRSLTLTDLERTINEARATVMMATPSLAALLRPSRLTTLQSLWTMGEKLNRTVIENFTQKAHNNDRNGDTVPTSRMLVNAYGPTEAAINCTFLAPVEYHIRGSIIGEPLPTCSMFVLDPASHTPKPIPAGLAGELAIGGPQVSQGYLNRPEETANSFVHSPEYGYLYRTGDMARIVWDEKGAQVIEFLGRITSDQVKISGRRVELGEIESVLATLTGAREVVAVVPKRDATVQGSEQIVACIVTDSSSEDAIREFVRSADECTHRHLAAYMCPSSYVFFDSIPRTSSGKVDRNAIDSMLQQGEDSGMKFYIPSNENSDARVTARGKWDTLEDEKALELRTLVLNLIAQTTGQEISVIKPSTSLYTLGLDSLGAMRLLQKLRDQFIDNLSVGDVLQSDTVNGLLSLILNVKANLGGLTNGQLADHSCISLAEQLRAFNDANLSTCAERLGISPGTIQTVLPTTETQSADSSFATRSYIYHSVISLGPYVDIRRLKKAWESVIATYDSFRTSFCWIDDGMAPFAQCILKEDAASAPNWAVYHTSGDSMHKDVLTEALREAENTISLDSPWKLSLLETSDDRVIILSMFHGIFDGGSLQLLLEDVSSVYNEQPPACRTSLEHVVVNHFQANQTATSDFWKEYLNNYSPIAFPSLTPYRPPAVKSTDCVEITARTTHDIFKQRSRTIGSTPLSVLQAAWASLLLAYTGTQDHDVVMGSVVSGRFDPASEICIGPTFTTIPTRLALGQIPKSGGRSWTNKSVVAHLASLNAKALSHLQPRLGSLVTADGRLPYDTVLAYQDFSAGSSISGPWTTIDHPPMANDYAVMIEVWPAADSSLTLRASFGLSQMDRDGAEVMLHQLDDIIAFILENPDGDFENALLHTRPDLKALYNPMPKMADEVLDGALIHTKFEDHANSHPDDMALLFKYDLDDNQNPQNISWTYGELNARADNLAAYLCETYEQLTNKVVPICIEKSPAMYIAILGILKAGGAWCPIDTFSPAQRRHDLIKRTGARVLLVSGEDGEQPKDAIPIDIDVVDVRKYADPLVSWPSIGRGSSKKLSSPAGIAYLIWTSGTTGAPKGVPITHSAAVSCFKSLKKDIPSDVSGGVVRCLQFSQYTFDVSIQDLFYAWSLGGVLISATREIMLGSFAKLANTTRATHAHLTPAFAAGVPRKSCETLEVITMIGEKLTQPVADDWGTDMRAYNTYGPAEVTIVSTVREFGNECRNVKSANVGWPMESVSVFVTKNRQIVMKNAVGELALGGPQLSPGYLNQEKVTKAKYVWSDEAGQILYYTGDLVRMLADGSLEFMNRVDDLVKLGGIRIELSEISFALGGCHPLVENIETLYIDRPDRPSKVLVAFLSASNATGANAGDDLLLLNDSALEIALSTREKAHTALPAYMIPSVYLVVKRIPRTQSAKTDRRALQAAYASVDIEDWENRMNPENNSTGHPMDDPVASDVMEKIVHMIASLINISPSVITKASRLRSLGIDSIHAVRLASRLKEAGYQLSFIEVINCVTVQDLIRLSTSSPGILGPPASEFDVNLFNDHWRGIVASKVDDEFFTVRASPIQESLLSETMGNYNLYWSNHFFSLDNSVDVTRLKQAWLALCQKNEALRTGFIPVAEVDNSSRKDELDFSILQVLYDYPTLDWEYAVCEEHEWDRLLHSRIEDVMKAHQKTYFRQPPWAVTVLDRGVERVMVLTIHHSIHDGPSLDLIEKDLRSAYTGKPPSRYQLKSALSKILPTEEMAAGTRSFWNSELQKYSELDAPAWPDLTGKRTPETAAQEHNLISEQIPVTEPLEKLQSLSAELGVSSIASLIRAAWGFVSLSYLGVPAAVFAETVSDRVLHADLDNGIGPLISVVPVPFNPTGTAREVLAEQQRISAQSRKYRHIHAREVRRMLKRPRGEPLYPAVFAFHPAGAEANATTDPGLWRELEDRIGLHVEHPMAFNVLQNADGSLALEAFSDASLMSHEHLSIFVRQVDSLISAMLANPDKELRELVNHIPPSLKSKSSQHVSEAVRNSVSLSPTHWLELNAREHPEWTAVEVASNISATGIEKQSMSYGTLNAAANCVAGFIASLGYKNRMIAVCAGRNLPSYPVIVGVFKSGNTYLPIDDNLPNDRKAFLIEDGNCPLVFTESAFAATFSDVPETCRVMCIDHPSFVGSLAGMPTDNRAYASDPQDNAYLLYTSGSTGRPKGVMVSRANLSAFIESFSEFVCRVAPSTLELGGRGRYLAQASRAFDVHLLEMFFAWRHGMASVTAERTMLLDDLQLTITKWGITHASMVPSLVDQTNLRPELCPELKYLSVGGEKISKRVLDTWAGLPHVALANAYGPTEVTIGCTFAHVGKETTIRNIGPPLSACTCHVLIPGTMNYALRGQTGELCFTGDIVGNGYLNRPDATGFVQGPDGEKMYRTGDIGRLMSDDSVEYVGRGDDQTKIRGQRLELGEVSEVIRSSSPVEIGVVTTVAKHPGLARPQLISFVARAGDRSRWRSGDAAIIHSDLATLGKELRDACQRKLPAYMVPEIVLPITYIPLAPMSGKANIKELHSIFSSLPLTSILQGNNPGTSDTAAFSGRALTSDEEAVVNEICAVIKIERESINPLTNIFEIGLDSLSAISLSVKLRRIGYDATVALVMSSPVVEQLAQLPRKSTEAATDQHNSELTKRLAKLEAEYHRSYTSAANSGQVVVRPCLPLQEGLVARSINSKGDQLYVNHVALKLDPGLDSERLRCAWQATADDNEILRTCFAPLEKEIVQVVLAPGYLMSWTEGSYDSLDECITQQRAKQQEISRGIIENITDIPPVRFHLATSSSSSSSSSSKRPLVLFVAIHHALYDGESFSMLLEDVAARYVGEPVIQRGSPADFITHVYCQNMERAQQHWVSALSDCRPTIFRVDTGGVEKTTFVNRKLRAGLAELERHSANLHATVPSLMQALFALLLADRVNASDVTYGLVLSGRAVAVPDADSVLLPCITTIPGRLNTNGLTTVAEVVRSLHQSTARSLEYQHTSLRRIQRWLKSEKPLFDCLFSYIRSTPAPKDSFWEQLESNMPSEYPLAVEIEANNEKDEVYVHCGFSASFGSADRGQEFVEKLDALLSAFLSGDDIMLDSFSLAGSGLSGPLESAVKWDATTWSTTETKIRDVTAAFCGLDVVNVSKGTSFISLGIDSVTAIQFARKLRELQFEVAPSDIMRFPCVGALAKHIDERSAGSRQSDRSEDKKPRVSLAAHRDNVRLLDDGDSVAAMFECTPLQAGMITQTLGSDSQVYVHPHIVRLSNGVNIDRLKIAIAEVASKNDILRTSFHPITENGVIWVGAVHTNPHLQWKEITLSSDADVIAEITSLYSFREVADFESPPLRFVLAHRENEKLFVVLMHHALYDGASLPLLFEDLAAAYRGQATADRPQFSEIAHHIVEDQNDSCDFWTNKLAGYDPVEIPAIPSSDATERMLLSERQIGLDVEKVVESCKAMEVTVQSVALLAYAKVLACLLGKRDVVFGQVLSGHSLPVPGADQTIGPLFNTVAQRVSFEPKFLSNREMAQRVQQVTSESQAFQHAPLKDVQKALRQEHGMTAASLFDTLFVFQKSADLRTGTLDEQQIWSPFETDGYAAQAEHKLNLEVDHGREGIVVSASGDGRYICQQALDEAAWGLPLRSSKAEKSEPEGGDSEVDAPAHELIVREVLAEVAGVPVDSITSSTSIYNIGLDSLSAIRIASICRSRGMKAGVADVLQGNTLRGISSRIVSTVEERVQTQEPLIENYDDVEKAVLQRLGLNKDAVETILPCLGGQLYHLASWLKSGRTLFEPAWSYYSSERIDSGKLEKAWDQLRQRHPILRTCFAATSPSMAVQVVLKDAPQNAEIFKVIESPACIEEAAKAQAREEGLNPSSLIVPPVRLRLLKASDKDGIQVFINHAAYDAWTMPMFVSELAQLYRGQSVESNPDFPSFVEHATRSLREVDEQAYWSSQLGSSVPTIIKPKDQELPRQSFVGVWEKVKNLSQLESTCRSAGLGLQSVVLLAVSRCFARMTGVQTPTIGLYQTGRSASFKNIESLSGPCLNVTPFTFPSPEAKAASNALDEVRAIQTSLAERVLYEQSCLREILAKWASTKGRGPLFNIWVNLLWMHQPSTQGDSHAESDLFQPLRIGVPTDFIPATPLPDPTGQTTSVSALDTSYLPDENLYIDIGPDYSTDTIGFGVRVEGGLLTEMEVHKMVGDLSGEIEGIMAAIQ
ncbi:nonribosomal siderophore peptide synthase SidC [Aspergillus novofumigatus IBT 16806]|uniref:Nonribosomal peptide synthetase sidC n=1 Tax=Aspergillus novofumigatus (strain IBT 16806) TaxID=1392255 RepID=A0A2I1C7I0_ASPN1|nr:nonribosomal siderophore peptide synthase SidC [Aspergillus novofumigatus IBT 16806]PKX93600.1 nonribosomal siderophore peptide synthase SidC [Aspergillus novofumigatus IBT 16806]